MQKFEGVDSGHEIIATLDDHGAYRLQLFSLHMVFPVEPRERHGVRAMPSTEHIASWASVNGRDTGREHKYCPACYTASVL